MTPWQIGAILIASIAVNSTSSRIREKGMIYLLLAIGLFLRVVNLNQSFWLDEAISALTAKKPFPFQWLGITGDFQPPLYYLLLHFWMKPGFWPEWFLRLPSLTFALLTIVIVYQFTLELFSQKTALLASLFLATSQFHIYYSQELRMYSLLCLLTTASMWFFYHHRWLEYIFTGLLGIYTSYMFPFIFLPQLVWVFLNRGKKDKQWQKWVFSIFFIALFFLPWLPIFFQQIKTGQKLMSFLPNWKLVSALPPWKLLPQIFLKFTLGRINFLNKSLYGGIFALLVIFYGFIFRSLWPNLNNKKILFVLNWFLTPLFASLFVSFFLPITGVWRLIFLLPPFLILVAFALYQIKSWKKLLFVILCINFLANFLSWREPRYQREKWREGVSYLEEDKAPIVFVVEEGFAPYWWYKKREKIICGPKTIERCLREKKIFYVAYLQDLFDKEKIVETKIKSSGKKIREIKDFPGVGFIYSYENSYYGDISSGSF